MILEVVQSKWSLTWYDPLGPRMCVLELMNGHVLQTLRKQLKVPGSRLEGSELLTSEFLRFRSRLNETSGGLGKIGAVSGSDCRILKFLRTTFLTSSPIITNLGEFPRYVWIMTSVPQMDPFHKTSIVLVDWNGQCPPSVLPTLQNLPHLCTNHCLWCEDLELLLSLSELFPEPALLVFLGHFSSSNQSSLHTFFGLRRSCEVVSSLSF